MAKPVDCDYAKWNGEAPRGNRLTCRVTGQTGEPRSALGCTPEMRQRCARFFSENEMGSGVSRPISDSDIIDLPPA